MTSFRTLFLIVVIALVAKIANAGGNTPEPPNPPTPPMPFMLNAGKMNCDKPPMLEHLKEELSLNADQETRIFAAMKQHCETTKAAHIALSDTMKHLLSTQQQEQLENLHRDHAHHRRHDGEHDHGKKRQ